MALMALETTLPGNYDYGFLPEPTAVGKAGQDLRNESEEELRNAIKASVFWRLLHLRREAELRIYELTMLKSNWDSYGAPGPSQRAFKDALRVLSHMHQFDLERLNIVPSAEGGIGFCFVKGKRYADIEVGNSGEIIGVRYVGMDPPVLIQVDGSDSSIKAALSEVRDHIDA